MAKPREYFCFDFCLGTTWIAIKLAVANGLSISCSLGRWYGPLLNLSFLDVYGVACVVPKNTQRVPEITLLFFHNLCMDPIS
jgi:hypothetical protein